MRCDGGGATAGIPPAGVRVGRFGGNIRPAGPLGRVPVMDVPTMVLGIGPAAPGLEGLDGGAGFT